MSKALFGKRRIFLTLSLIFFCGFMTTSLLSYLVARGSLNQEISKISLPLSGESIYFEMNLALAKPIQISRAMAQNTFFHDWVKNGESDILAMEKYLANIQHENQTFSAFFVSEATRKYYHPTGKERQVTDAELKGREKWYADARAMTDDFAVVVDEDKMRDDQMAIFVNHRVLGDDGKFLGVTGVGIALDTAQKLLEKTAARYQRTLYFVDPSGNVVLSGRDYVWPSSINETDGLAAHAQDILKSDNYSIQFERQDKTVFLNSRLIEDVGWRLIVEQTADSVHEPIYMTLIGNILVTLLLTAVMLFLAHLVLRGYQAKLETLATHDALTGTLNRHAFDVILEQEILGAKRKKDAVFTIAILDIDHFKSVNDTYGHLMGDAVLKDLVTCAMSKVRESDVFCRWGGEEFMLLLRDCDMPAAQKLVEGIRHAIESHIFEYNGQQVHITVSAGLSQFEQSMDNDQLFMSADKMLYLAKNSGRNRIMPMKEAA